MQHFTGNLKKPGYFKKTRTPGLQLLLQWLRKSSIKAQWESLEVILVNYPFDNHLGSLISLRDL